MEAFAFLLEQTEDVEIGEGAIVDIVRHSPEPEEVLELLLSHGVQIEITEKILIAAAGHSDRHGHILKFLLEQGSDINITENVIKAAALSRQEKNLLVLSAHCKIAEIPARWLNLARLSRAVCHAMDHHVDYDQDADYGIEMVKELLAQGVEPDVADTDGRTMLSHAVRGGHELVVQALLSAEANPNHQDKQGVVVTLIEAAAKGYCEIVKILLSHGANPNLEDRRRRTPLSEAARVGHYTKVEILLDKGALSHVRDEWGNTPGSLAKYNGFIRIFRLLERRRNRS